MATEKEVKQFEKEKAALVKQERRIVDDVLRSHLAAAKTIETKELKKHLVAHLTALRGDIGEARKAVA